VVVRAVPEFPARELEILGTGLDQIAARQTEKPRLE
jgi:hypothetical protein